MTDTPKTADAQNPYSCSQAALDLIQKIEDLSIKDRPFTSLLNQVKVIDEVLEQARADGYDKGYTAGHEDQMKMRILDAQERRNCPHCNKP